MNSNFQTSCIECIILFIYFSPLLAAHTGNNSVLSELCGTLSRLAVRNEFCQDIVDLGGLKFMANLLADNLDHQVLQALVVIEGYIVGWLSVSIHLIFYIASFVCPSQGNRKKILVK